MAYTTTEFLESVKDRASIPAATNLTDAKLLVWADDETRSRIVPFILSKKENFLVGRYEVATTAFSARYRLPSRAVGVKVKDIQIRDSGGRYRSLDWHDEADLTKFDPSISGRPEAFSVEGNELILYPTPNLAETLVIPYYRRPNALVATSAVATITSFDTGTGVITCSGGVPSTISTSTPVDIVKAKPGHEWLTIDVTPTGKGATTVTLSSLPSDLAVGDYVCLAEQSPVPQIPLELIPLLAERTALRYAQTKGDVEFLKYLAASVKDLEASAFANLSPRVDDEAFVVAGGIF